MQILTSVIILMGVGHGKILKPEFFSAPQNHHIMIHGPVQFKNQRNITVDINLFPVNLQNLVPDLQATFVVEDTAIGKFIDHRRNHLITGQIQDRKNQNTHNKVHGSTGNQNDQPFPPGCFVKSTGVIAVTVLPFHGAVAADGDTAQGIQCLTDLFFEDSRTHKHGEFIDLYTGKLGCNKMPKLMNKDQDAE